jgi:ATP synthase protein I
MSDPDKSPDLEALDAKLKAAEERLRPPTPDRPAGISGWGLAGRVGVELVAAIGGGAFFGWLLDRWLGTSPFLLIALFLLGGAAGVVNVNRAMTRLMGDQAKK